mgnify:CR=1 FL=1
MSFKGFRHSEQAKRKISKANKGRNEGYKHTEEAKLKMRGHRFTEEHKRKLSEVKKGRKFSKARRKRMSQRFKGRKFTDEHKKNISLGKKKRQLTGEKSAAWKGGISKDIEHIRLLRRRGERKRRIKRKANLGAHTLGDWETLKAQYNWTCPACGKIEPQIKLTEDHVIPLSKGGSDNIENIQPLCVSCNSKKYTKVIRYDYKKSLVEILSE